MNPLLLVMTFCGLVSIAWSQPADIIYRNATVWTVDPQKPEVQAVAVRGGRILAVGTNAEIDRFTGPKTEVVDVGGKLMLPGFIDDHTHFMSGGFQLNNVDLRYAANEQEFARRIRERAKEKPKRWITGGDWDHDNWPDGKLPTKELIDAFTPNTPVFVNRYDGHMALANKVALALAKITKATPDPPGGTIVRDPKTGEPTGLLKDAAMDAVYRIMPDPTEDEMVDAANLALAEARRFGLTSIQDCSSAADTGVYRKLLKNGQLAARMYCRLPMAYTDNYIKKGMKAHTGDEWIRVGALKAFADGSLGSSTALFFDKYVSEDTRGLATDVVLNGHLERWALAGDKAGMQLSIHAIGDSANSLVLGLFEKIVRENPEWDRRFRIEHAQHIRPQDFQRFAKLGVIASAQPYHAIDDGRWAENRIGHERCKTTYPFRTFLDNGVHLSFGSDWTVAPLNPLLGIYAAVTRQTTDGVNPDGWFPEQKISVKEAIACYTINNAYAAFEEKEKGSITPGKLADFVILSENILAVDPVRIQHVTVERTIVGGNTVFIKK
jgi:predicted amidohydrolase YtcJ